MLLQNYFQNLKKDYSHYTFSNIAFDSSKVKKNYIFFAIKGNMHDGHLYINDAIKKGAKIIIHEKKYNGIKNNVLFLYSKNVRKKLAEVSFQINKSIPKNLILREHQSSTCRLPCAQHRGILRVSIPFLGFFCLFFSLNA